MITSNAKTVSGRPLVSAAIAVWVLCSILPGIRAGRAQDSRETRGKSSYDQVTPMLLGQETFQERMAKDQAARPEVTARQRQLLESRYDLAPRPDAGVKMTRGKPLQVGPATRLSQGM